MENRKLTTSFGSAFKIGLGFALGAIVVAIVVYGLAFPIIRPPGYLCFHSSRPQ